MSLLRKGSKATLRPCLEDFQSALDHKNAIIASLQTERESLAPTQDRYDRAREELQRAKGRLEAAAREHEGQLSNNQERLELTVRAVAELRGQADQLAEELRARGAALREARFAGQQAADLAQRREEETAEARLRLEEQQALSDVRGMEQERSRLQIGQLREEVEKGRRENGLLREHGDTLLERTHKTQSYIRSLLRQEGNLSESLSQLEEENGQLQASIAELDTAVSINEGAISNKQKDCQELQFHIASRELERRKIDQETREKAKQLSLEREKARALAAQVEQGRAEAARLDSQLADTSAEVNFILGKNGEIGQVNAQLRDDLTVCQRHLDNLARLNRTLQTEVGSLHATSLKAISKLREPFASRGNAEAVSNEKWGAASRATNFETGDFESWR